jgi:hypothetical protein
MSACGIALVRSRVRYLCAPEITHHQFQSLLIWREGRSATTIPNVPKATEIFPAALAIVLSSSFDTLPPIFATH